MKKIIILMFFLFKITFTFSQSEGGVISYKVKLNLENVDFNNNKVNDEATLKIKKIIKNAKPLETRLVFKDGKSYYGYHEELNGVNSFNIIKSFISEKDYFTDLTNSKQLVHNNIYGQSFLIEMKNKKWELTNDTKNIGKYLCYKAIFTKTTRGKIVKIIAWYTPEISMSFGPSEYFGLPGLILQVNDGVLIITVNKVTIPQEIKRIKTIPNGKLITEEEFVKISNRIYIDRKQRMN